VQFVIIDLDKKRPSEQQKLVEQYYEGYIPHVVVLDKNGKARYSSAGEVEESAISKILDQALQ
jgi:predicted transcriptional regulator